MSSMRCVAGEHARIVSKDYLVACVEAVAPVVPELSLEVQVWDSSAEHRYLVLPERPGGTDGLSEEQLAELVTRDAMIGVARL